MLFVSLSIPVETVNVSPVVGAITVLVMLTWPWVSIWIMLNVIWFSVFTSAVKHIVSASGALLKLNRM